MTSAPLVDVTVFSGAFVYTANERTDVHPTGSVLVVGDRIAAVGDETSVEASIAGLEPDLRARLRRVDARDSMIVPGFVNPHYHEAFILRAANLTRPVSDLDDLPGSFAHGLDAAALSRQFDTRYELLDRIRPDEAEAVARYSLWTLLRSGITAFGDVGSVNRPEALVSAARSIGIRAAVSLWTTDGFCDPEASLYRRTRPAKEVLDRVDELGKLCAADDTGRIRLLVSSIYTVSEELGLGLAELTSRYNTAYATHVCAGPNETPTVRACHGTTPIRWLDRLGLLNDRLIAVHCAFVDDGDRGLVVDAGAHICHAPAKYGTSGEQTISGGGRQIMAFRQAGLDVSASTDGESVPIGGMIEAMRQAWLSHNEASADPTSVLPTEALAMGTRVAAKGLRWHHEIGSIEPGKQADLVLIPITDWRYTIVPRPLESLLNLGSSADVHTVMVAGRILVEGGRPVGFDESDLRTAAIEASVSFSTRELGTDPADITARLSRLS